MVPVLCLVLERVSAFLVAVGEETEVEVEGSCVWVELSAEGDFAVGVGGLAFVVGVGVA